MIKNSDFRFASGKLLITIVTILLSVFFVTSLLVFDPDFGWHFKFGEFVSRTGMIPKKDLFSYTMPSYPHINHSWLYDVLLFNLYQTVGSWGLALLFSGIVVASLFLVIPPGLFLFSLPALILSATMLLFFTGVRPQVLSFLFIAFLIRCFFNKDFYSRVRFFLPLVFFSWVNLHGAFASGLVLLAVYVCYLIATKQAGKKDIAILLTSFLVTCISPYGIRIWDEVFRTVFSSSLHKHIAEWQSVLNFLRISVFIGIGFPSFFIFRMRKKLDPFQITIYVVFLLLGLSSIRHLPIFSLIALPLTTIALHEFFLSLDQKKVVIQRATLAYKGLIFICLLVAGYEFFMYGLHFKSISEAGSYPGSAAEYISRNSPQQNVFTEYEWAGYLLWKADLKTFADGRMPIWQWDAPTGESSSAFEEYMDLKLNEKSEFLPLAEKFDIQTVILRTTSSPSVLNKKVESAGFKKVYSDEIATIYLRD